MSFGEIALVLATMIGGGLTAVAAAIGFGFARLLFSRSARAAFERRDSTDWLTALLSV